MAGRFAIFHRDGDEPAETAQSEPARDSRTARELSLSEANFEQLRALGMSVTQAKRVIRHREQRGGFRSLEELDAVPGFPRAFLGEIRERVVP